jgi:hypothetical protein
MQAIDFSRLKQIAPSSGIYAIIDLASEDEIYDYLLIYEPRYRCLYDGELKIQYEVVAPHIVELQEECEFTKWYLAQTSNKNQGIFIQSSYDIDVLTEHFMHYAIIEIDSNDLDEAEVAGEFNVQTTHALFAFYDPRVFREWMPTLPKKERETFYSLLESIMVQNPKEEKEFLLYEEQNNLLFMDTIQIKEEEDKDELA